METIVARKTEIFFPRQSVEGIIQAVRNFEKVQKGFVQSEITNNARRFNAERFKNEIYHFVNKKWVEFGND